MTLFGEFNPALTKINVEADEPVLFEAKKINLPEGNTTDNDSYTIALLTKLREECLKKYN